MLRVNRIPFSVQPVFEYGGVPLVFKKFVDCALLLLSPLSRVGIQAESTS